jgi:hypothetical protein
MGAREPRSAGEDSNMYQWRWKMFIVRKMFGRKPKSVMVDQRVSQAHWETHYDQMGEVHDEMTGLAAEDAALSRACDQIDIEIFCATDFFTANIMATDANRTPVLIERVVENELQDLLWEVEKKLRVLARMQLESERVEEPVGLVEVS